MVKQNLYLLGRPSAAVFDRFFDALRRFFLPNSSSEES